ARVSRNFLVFVRGRPGVLANFPSSAAQSPDLPSRTPSGTASSNSSSLGTPPSRTLPSMAATYGPRRRDLPDYAVRRPILRAACGAPLASRRPLAALGRLVDLHLP